MTASTIDPIQETFSECRRLSGFLSQLTSEQWEAHSLCAGWRVREVVAHLTMPYRTPRWRVVAGILGAGFSFNRYANRAACADTRALTDAELLASYRANITNPWRPPGGGAIGALSHEVIHGLDITEPLHLPPAPPDRIALVLQAASPRQLKYFGVDLQGHRLVATDADATVGSGEPVSLPAKDILLIVTGRQAMT